MQNLDGMIMDVEVEVKQTALEERVKIKFLAIKGGNGPELNLSHLLAETLRDKLNTALAVKP
jgi:hypothetical protein